MSEIMRRSWATLHREADWRAFTGGEAPWLQHPAVIIGGSGHGRGQQAPRRQSYEVYIEGRLVAQRHSLAEAKGYVEAQHGSVEWRQGRTEPVTVTHYYFGETDEFSSPSTYWYVEAL